MENPTKVFLIDDSEIHLAGLNWYLSKNQHFTVSGSATNAKDALENKAIAHTDVVLLDLTLETAFDGIDLIDPLKKLNPNLKIIVLSHYKDVTPIVKSFQKGVSAYIAKDTSIEELYTVIELAGKGNGFFLGETIPKTTMLNFFTNNNHHQKPWNLSEREIAIIDLLAKGFLAKEIAEKLHITIPTVESHKENIKQKLACKTIIEVVVFAMKNGLIS